jgi:hypothetical protein
MILFLLLLLPIAAHATSFQPAPFPIFLKAGFSSVLEFDETPARVVLGNSQSFQVEKLDHSLVIKALAPYAATNMFVYFNSQDPRLFVLTASEDAEPTYYRKFESPKLLKQDLKVERSTSPPAFSHRGTKILSTRLDPKKDYLTVEAELSADGKEVLRPMWAWVRLKTATAAIMPFKLWAERQEIQRDSLIKARFIFAKPNVPRNLKGVSLIIPLQGNTTPLVLSLRGGKR